MRSRRLYRMTLYQYYLAWYKFQGRPYHKCWLNDTCYVTTIERRNSKLSVTLDNQLRREFAFDFEIEVEVY